MKQINFGSFYWTKRKNLQKLHYFSINNKSNSTNNYNNNTIKILTNKEQFKKLRQLLNHKS